MANSLIIECNKLLKWALIEMIKREGLNVYTADDCLAAEQIAEKHDFHLIFADVGFEKSETLEILKRIQTIQAKSRFVLMTSLPRSEINGQTGNLKVLAILEKPFDLIKIRSVIRESIGII